MTHRKLSGADGQGRVWRSLSFGAQLCYGPGFNGIAQRSASSVRIDV